MLHTCLPISGESGAGQRGGVHYSTRILRPRFYEHTAALGESFYFPFLRQIIPY